LPLIRAIAATTPEHAITFLTPPSSQGAELLQAESCVARTLYFEHGGSELARVFQLARLTQMLRELRPQTVWILDKTVRPALAAFLARVPQRLRRPTCRTGSRNNFAMGLMVATRELRSLSRLRERVGVRVFPQRDSPRGESPHPALRADLPRKRER